MGVPPTDYRSGSSTSNSFVTLGPPTPTGGKPIDITSPVPLLSTRILHAGDPLFIRVTDLDQNLDPTALDTILVSLTDGKTGDVEMLRLTETGPNTGVFLGYLPTAVSSVASYDGTMSVSEDSAIEVRFTDPLDGTDAVAATTLVDPHGLVFDSRTGLPVNGATVTIFDALTGKPATVLGDNGVSTFPSSVTSGGTATDGSGRTYDFPPGGFRFPFMTPGTYRLVVTPPASYTSPSAASDTAIQALPGAPFALLTPGSRGEVFMLNAGPALRVDIPVDPATPGLWIQKGVSRDLVSIGDFVPYDLTLTNLNISAPATGVSIDDRLPVGFRYRAGSTRINDAPAPDPAQSADGRTLIFPVGTIPAKGIVRVRYVVEVSAGAVAGDAVNSATATAAPAAPCNTATAKVRVQEPFLRSRSIIMGRVVVGPCTDKVDETRKGMEGVGIYLEDGTFVLSDKLGLFHFEGVRPGTHVVQLDLDSIPDGYEILPCEENSRFAGRSFSQFVDLQGGTLWRADFYLSRKPQDAPPVEMPAQTGSETGLSSDAPVPQQGIESIQEETPQVPKPARGAITLELASTNRGTLVEYRLPLQASGVAPSNLRLLVSLPEGVGYQPGSSSLNGALLPDPEVTPKGLLYDLGNAAPEWRRELQLRAVVGPGAGSGELVTRARLTFDSPGHKGMSAPEVTNILELVTDRDFRPLPPFVFHPRFPTFGAELSETDRGELDRLAKLFAGKTISRIDVTGHTDNVRIAPRSRRTYADNTALSYARAGSVGRYLSSALHLPPSVLTLNGSGDHAPVATNRTAEGRARNRRVAVVIWAREGIESSRLKMVKDHSGVEKVETTDKAAPRIAQEGTATASPAKVAVPPVAERPEALPAATGLGTASAGAAALPAAAASGGEKPAPGAERPKSERTVTPEPTDEHVKLQAAMVDGILQYRVRLKGSREKVGRLRATVAVPGSVLYVTGSATMSDAPAADPDVSGSSLLFTVTVPEDTPFDLRFQAVPEGDGLPEGFTTTARIDVIDADGSTVRTLSAEAGLSDTVEDEPVAAPPGPAPVPLAATKERDESELYREHIEKKVEGAGKPAATEAGLHVKEEEGIRSFADGDVVPTKINAVRVVLNSLLRPALEVDGKEIPADRIGFSLKDRESGRSLYTYIGVDFGDAGTHTLRLRGMDEFGQARYDKSVRVTRSGEITRIVLVSAEGNVADGRTPVRVRVQLYDEFGKPVNAPAELSLKGGNLRPPVQPGTLSREGSGSQVSVSGDGWVSFNPVTASGLYRAQLAFNKAELEVETYVKPKFRDWILVGLAEGTAGYNAVSGHVENLKAGGGEENFYDRERLAFYAKGTIKGEWLLTMAYDNRKERTGTTGNALFQTIDPNANYTLYGDATNQGYDAASARALYLKIERDQFYAMFGDFDTGMTVTELSAYSRRMNGVKSELRTGRYDLTLFGSQTDQAFAKDELRGDGTSGIYKLSRKGIVINSEKITIESRDRFKSEVVVSSRPLSRFLDYTIDYDAGTLFFKEPVASRDGNFNPVYIVVDYEVTNDRTEALTYGGRAGVKFLDGALKLGVSHVHEGHISGRSELFGVDGTLLLGRDTRLRAEAATTNTDAGTLQSSGNAFLAELAHTGSEFQGKLYFREQEEGFGVGQQKGSEAGTRKFGAEADYRLSKEIDVKGQTYRQYNLAAGAVRDLVEGLVAYTDKNYSARTGLRYADDSLGDGSSAASVQATAGASWKTLNDRLTLRADHDQSLFNKNRNADFPTRTVVGADYQASKNVAVTAQEELTYGSAARTYTTRVGMKATPWTGGGITSSVVQDMKENSERTFATTGLSQKLQLNPFWTVDGSLDRTQTIRRKDGYQFNTNVPPASGGEDFTALSLGANFVEKKLTWANRFEFRDSDTEDKWGVITSVANEQGITWGWTGRLQVLHSRAAAGTAKTDADLRLGLAYRPPVTRWIVLDRLDLVMNDEESPTSSTRGKRIINNLSANFRPDKQTQISLLYGAKYVLETIDGNEYSGVTDLVSVEGRHDLTKTWDIGLRGSILHSWYTSQISYSTGPSVGYNIAQNVWVSLGYNVVGFTDKDFSAGNFTSQGPYVQFRFKFDQQSVREAVGWLNR
jgi:uncharacterized repeat protein (TIGR01451 family)